MTATAIQESGGVHTPAADEALKMILRESGNVRNRDFEKFLDSAVAMGKTGLRKVLDEQELSQRKPALLRNALKKTKNIMSRKMPHLQFGYLLH